MKAAKSHEPDKSDTSSVKKGSASEAGALKQEYTPWSQIAFRVQTKLNVGASDDPLEREADAVAEQVMQFQTPGAPNNGVPWGQSPDSRVNERLCTDCEEDLTIRRLPAAPEEEAPQSLLVETDAVANPGQLRKDEFLAEVRLAVCRAIEPALASRDQTAEDCPYLQHLFPFLEHQSVRFLETTLRRFSPDLRTAVSARAYLPAIIERVRFAATNWLETGKIAGLPEGLPPTLQALAGLVGGTGGRVSRATSVQLKGKAGGLNQDTQVDTIPARLGPGHPLESPLRGQMESAFGSGFPDVRIHDDATAALLASEVNARAFTIGPDVAFGAGEYRPGTASGDLLIAHELAHVIQQRGAKDSGNIQAKTLGHRDLLEEDADRSAIGAVTALWSGGRYGIAGIPRDPRPRLNTKLKLQRCGCDKPTTTDAFALGLKSKGEAAQITDLLDELRGLNGSRAGDASIREVLRFLKCEGKLSYAELFRAVALQELGAERLWSPVITNFAEGLDNGAFRISNMPPPGANALHELAVLTAGRAGETVTGPALAMANYRHQFNAKWTIAPYDVLPTTFDDALDSKGPRNARARQIFKDIYGADSEVQQAYDAGGGFREFCDMYSGPDATNLIASPRLQALLVLFRAPRITATGTADPVYQAFVSTVRPLTLALDAPDRQEVRRNRHWRIVMDNKVRGTTTAITQSLIDDLRSVMLNTLPPAPAPGLGPVRGPAPPEPVVIPNAAQTRFLSGISLAGPASPVDVNTAEHDLVFAVTSTVPNPSLGVRRRVIVEPAAKVLTGDDDQTAWANGGNAVPHTARVAVDGDTDFTARLTMLPLPPGSFAEKSVTVRVLDKRLHWFLSDIKHGLLYTNENVQTFWAPGASLHYHGGQMVLGINPILSRANPNLTIYMRGELKKNGAVEATYPPLRFGTGTSTQLGTTIVLAGTPAPLMPDRMELTIEFFSSAVMAGPPLRIIMQAFEIQPALPAAVGGDAGLIAADNAWLNQPAGTAGSFLHYLKTFGPGSVEDRVADLVASGAIKLQACVVRSDSAAWIAAAAGRGNPSTQVAYACGVVDDAHTFAGQPNAVGWYRPIFPDHVFLNVTPDSHRPASKRAFPVLGGLFVHEAIHATDMPQTNIWDRYQREFRAYWVQGIGAGLREDFDPAFPDDIGPKSQRANAIFRHVYGSATYEWVKPAYDANTNNFRERVDNYLHPDAINLILSPRLADLRSEIESYTGSGYAAKKGAIRTKFTACNATDRQHIAGNRSWRDLVESKFSATTWWGDPEVVEIKRMLGIPR